MDKKMKEASEMSIIQEEEEESLASSVFGSCEKNPEFRLLISQYFEILEDEEFINCVTSVIEERRHLILENKIFQEFLIHNEPQLLPNMPHILEAIEELEDKSPLMPPILNLPKEPLDAFSIIFSEVGARLNVASKHDLVLRCIEEIEANLKAFLKKAQNHKFILNAEIEEAGIQVDEVSQARSNFEKSMEVAVDPITNRIPAEKFIWFMDEWLKNARQVTEKIRLRNISLKRNYHKTKVLLDQKLELGIIISRVDFDQYKIENANLKERIEISNGHLFELKQFNGKANLDLAETKRSLQFINTAAKNIKAKITKSENDKKEYERICEEATKSLADVKAEYEKVKALIAGCHAPDILEYVKVKAELHNLLKTKKILERKENLQKIVWNSTKRAMLELTGEKTLLKQWLEVDEQADEDDELEEEMYQMGLGIGLDGSNTDVTVDPLEFDIFTIIKCGNNQPLIETKGSLKQQSRSRLRRFRSRKRFKSIHMIKK